MSSGSKTIVRQSPIAGRGLFANQRFKKGRRIIKLLCKRNSRDWGAYTVIDTDGSAHKIVNKARFMNHARPPNAKMEDDDWVRSLRVIEPGEEITIDYGKGREPSEEPE